MSQTYEILTPEGVVENTIIADLAFVQAVYPGRWRVVAEPASPAEPEAKNNRLSPLAFLRRFTDEERVRFDLSSIDDPNDPEDKRKRAAQLRMFEGDYKLASYVRLDDPRTMAGVKGLEALGIIAKGRAKEVLETPARPEEMPEAKSAVAGGSL